MNQDLTRTMIMLGLGFGSIRMPWAHGKRDTGLRDGAVQSVLKGKTNNG